MSPGTFPPEPTFRCRICWDEGYAAVDEAANTVRPCPACRPDQDAHWRAGGYRPSEQGGAPLSAKRGRREDADAA